MGVQANMEASNSTTTMIATGPTAAAASPPTNSPSPPINPRQPQRSAAQRKRKSAMKDFNNDDEYKNFARRRNEATRRCRQKKEIELKDLRDEVPQIKAANKALQEENGRLKAENARLVEELKEALAKLSTGGVTAAAPPPAEKSGKKQKKKAVKTSAVKDNWSGLDDLAAAADTLSPEEADYCWYSDFLDTTIAYSPDNDAPAEAPKVGSGSTGEPSQCSTIQMLDIAIPTDDVLCPGPSRQN